MYGKWGTVRVDVCGPGCHTEGAFPPYSMLLAWQLSSALIACAALCWLALCSTSCRT